jgi:antitoxin CptB
MGEAREFRLKRLRLRAWRRGTRELDLVLGGYADARIGSLDAEGLAAFEALLSADDQDLQDWVLGQRPAPEALRPALEAVLAHAAGPGAV